MKPLRPLTFPPSPGWQLLVGLLIFATNLSAQENWQVEGTPPTLWSATLWTFDTTTETWTQQTDASVKAGKGHPNTIQANIMVGDWHWFLSHNVHYLGRVHVETGVVEYLELPAQLMPSSESRELDLRLWGTGNPNNRPLNAAGLAVGDKAPKSNHLLPTRSSRSTILAPGPKPGLWLRSAMPTSGSMLTQ